MVGLERTLIGRTLAGRYSVEELIGQGRGGLVFRARDGETDAEVALKVLAGPRSPEARERYRRVVAGEVGVASALRDPHVVAVHGLGFEPEGELDFVTFELARGQTLASVLAQRGKPPISLGLRLLQDAADGLAAGHRAGLVHRDLRPASLYLVRSEAERQVRVKVGGFGVPQIVRAASLAAAPPEESGYASPEMLVGGSARLTPASDVFSLGAIGFELMTGALPLDDDARRALAAGGQVEVVAPADVPTAVPPHVLDAVLQALRVAPSERFADGAAFAAALAQPGSARTASPTSVAVPVIVAAPPEAAPAAPAEPTAVTAPELVVEPTSVDSVDTAAGIALAQTGDAPAAEPVSTEPAASAEEPGISPPEAESTPATSSPDRVLAFAGRVLPGESVPETVAAETPAAPDSVEAEAPAAAAPSAGPSAAIPRTRNAPPPRAVGADLELYYPPQAATPAAATTSHSAASAPPAEAIAAAAPVSGDVAIAAASSAAPIAVIPAEATQVGPAAAPSVKPIAPRALSMGGTRKQPPSTRSRGFRGSAMAAGFVMGILVLGTVAFMATRRGPTATAAPAANRQLAADARAAAVPVGAAADAQRSAATVPPATGDTTARAVEARRRAQEELKRRQQQEEERRRQEEQARLAQLPQQQPLALAQQAAQQPAPRPQTVTPPPVQQPVANAPRPVAPPPAPPPAPPAREEPAPAREAAASNEVYDVGDVEERPRLSNAAEIQRALQARYPEQLSAARISGSVTASFVVNSDGRVDGSSIRIVGSPNPAFNVPTQNVLRRARFRPATVGGQPVRVHVTMPVQWTAPQ